MGILEISVLTAGIAIALGSLMTGLAQGMAVAKAVEGISRQPEASGKIQGALIIGLAFIESIAIYVLAISIIILFANPLSIPASNLQKAKSEVEVIKLEIEKIKLEKDLAAAKSFPEKQKIGKK